MSSPSLRIPTARVIEFVHRYRRKGAFKGFSEQDIYKEFFEHHFIIVGHKHAITGMATGDVRGDHCHVRQILTTRRIDLALIARQAVNQWPNIRTISFNRHGSKRLMSFAKLMERIASYGRRT